MRQPSHEANRAETCATCGHAMNRHDPDDGTCDAPHDTEFRVCPCGREAPAPAVAHKGFTPGPWQATGCGVYAGVSQVCLVNGYIDDHDEVSFANARLAAAAPSLFAETLRIGRERDGLRANLTVAECALRRIADHDPDGPPTFAWAVASDALKELEEL